MDALFGVNVIATDDHLEDAEAGRSGCLRRFGLDSVADRNTAAVR
jgi:hypothetical protein